ncbi:hypothetical protein SERLA73DRAFT_54283 [Serpula lacrymans var. lacrymans S7.3]|uniref:Enoyl reductase (ER) domain-containing protein n=2 Tax=Serpula lacrymans var. lacrymans TaxID=341189 RepID=F8PXQ1_SERL3|nr:uncharacterized protein SERLADRAFT_437880 [Serpula lacrymans var. lacrymans S7.9]EGN98664.1 hypothetical protein SERLA73DRAFT_54283 [Serpula lacrymans var. lacrymans S7.3]EGO24268.1 hypothetical protein SERLADRAFT_437880 [Serpula lacrymans var. lacrymans S7.9]
MGLDFTVYKGSEDGRIVKATTHRDSLKPDDVLVRVTHSGLCGTDLHYRTFDVALGHEGVGLVQEIGTDVKSMKVGDRVGWGYEHGSCGYCDECLGSHEMYCPDRQIFGSASLDQGSFSTHAVWPAKSLFHIPESMSSADAAPLMCAGSTVYNVFHLHSVSPTDRIGIVGIGGLGHLAIQFAAKMGCQVVVFSSTENKRKEAMDLGATEFYPTKDTKTLYIGPKLKHLIVTTSEQPDWSLYLPVLAPRAAIYPLSISLKDLTVPYMPLLMNGLTIQGCMSASRGAHIKMLNFAAFHNIKPINQVFPLNIEGIEEAMQKLHKGEIRYRVVLVAEGA